MSEATQLERFAVSAESTSETKTVVETRDFEFAIDEPAALGGTDDAPNPVEYLLGAWAGCLTVVVHTVATERRIDVDGVKIGIQGDIDLRKFFGTADDVRAGYQEISVRITIESDADQAALDALALEVEERCPVGDTIGNPTPTDVIVDVA